MLKKVFCVMAAMLGLVIAPAFAGDDSFLTSRRCINEKMEILMALPEKTSIRTLDGQEIPLAPFGVYRKLNRFASLPQKFYYWENETKMVNGYKVRTYRTPGSACIPSLSDKILGNVTELYDKTGLFVGFVVSPGDGIYLKLPDPKFLGKLQKEREEEKRKINI